uniref:Selenoprotein O n=1 Tax=Phallusia mammillata TaxID=59560 RepID=A0A6F9DSH5_9ASCI|nr:selenoprotein O [Phallusia mammillata]
MTKQFLQTLRVFRTIASSANMESIQNINLENLALKSLPVDESKRPGTRKVSGACFSLVDSTPVESPRLVAKSTDALKLLNISGELNDEGLAKYFSGNKLLPGSVLASHCYCGHQFGYFSGQLGDGTVAYLGDLRNSNDERWEMQLKGIGPTPYSRAGDGRKVLRSSIREFLCSESMHHLGIPTTRAGAVVDSDTLVTRDMFYDGRARREHCALVLRIAPTFLRFGSFEIFKPSDETTGKEGPSVGQTDILIKLLKYTIETFYPEIAEEIPVCGTEQYLKFYKEVCLRTARMVAKWQCVGFCHGVLNTDNMSVLGLTIDYGPFGFLDVYDPDFICNSSDENGRYSYKKQPEICKWNLKKFAEALQDVLPLESSLQVLNEVYDNEFTQTYNAMMRKKIGLANKHDDDEMLIKQLLLTMKETFSDFTNTFRNLNLLDLPGVPNHEASKAKLLETILSCCLSLEDVKQASKPSIAAEQLDAIRALAQQNADLLALFGGEGTLQREIDKLEAFEKLQSLSEEEYTLGVKDKWTTWIEMYVSRLQQLTNDEGDVESLNAQRKEMMNLANPKYILRNYIAQNAIEEAEKGNYLEVQNVLRRLENPWSDTAGFPLYGFHNIMYNSPPPTASMGLRLS